MQHHLAEELYSKTETLAELLKMQGLEVPPYFRRQGGPFMDLPTKDQRAAALRLSETIENYEILVPETNPGEQLRLILNQLQLDPADKEVYRRLEKSHVWEIVDYEINQVFRNSEIYKTVSYSLEELETYSPWVLYRRPEKVLGQLIEITNRLQNGNSIVELAHIPAYVIQESLTGHNNKVENRHDFACPLLDKKTGKNIAFLSALHMRMIPETEDHKVISLG